MTPTRLGRATLAVPVLASLALVVSACGSGSSSSTAQQDAAAAVPAAAAPAAAAPAAAAPAAVAPAAPAAAAPAAKTAKTTKAAKAAPVAKAVKAAAASGGAATGADQLAATKSDTSAANQQAYNDKNGATDIGVTKDQIKLGSVNMHGMALGNLITGPQVRGNQATAAAINDRGGVLGRRIQIQDCDDGPGEVSRAKACIKKLVGQDHIFSMITGIDWATASIHDDLKQYHLPYVGAWAYSQTEWQDPFMFPSHMSMIHEAMAGAHWAANTIQPKTYGLICLTSPEMQLACNAVPKIMDASGSKMVKRADVSISETSMSAYVLAMRAANPDHIIHYVI